MDRFREESKRAKKGDAECDNGAGKKAETSKPQFEPGPGDELKDVLPSSPPIWDSVLQQCESHTQPDAKAAVSKKNIEKKQKQQKQQSAVVLELLEDIKEIEEDNDKQFEAKKADELKHKHKKEHMAFEVQITIIDSESESSVPLSSSSSCFNSPQPTAAPLPKKPVIKLVLSDVLSQVSVCSSTSTFQSESLEVILEKDTYSRRPLREVSTVDKGPLPVDKVKAKTDPFTRSGDEELSQDSSFEEHDSVRNDADDEQAEDDLVAVLSDDEGHGQEVEEHFREHVHEHVRDDCCDKHKDKSLAVVLEERVEDIYNDKHYISSVDDLEYDTSPSTDRVSRRSQDVRNRSDGGSEVYKQSFAATMKLLLSERDMEAAPNSQELVELARRKRLEAICDQRKRFDYEEDATTRMEVFVANIDYTTTEEQLVRLFSRCGEVTDVTLPLNPGGKTIRGIGFVTFGEESSVARAIEMMDGEKVNGRKIQVRRNKGKVPLAVKQSMQRRRVHQQAYFPLSRSGRRPPLDSNTAFVGNLPFSTTSDELLDLVETTCGVPVHACRIVLNDRKCSRGFGYVDLFDADSVAVVLDKLNGLLYEGRVIRADYASGFVDKSRFRHAPASLSSPTGGFAAHSAVSGLTAASVSAMKIEGVYGMDARSVSSATRGRHRPQHTAFADYGSEAFSFAPSPMASVSNGCHMGSFSPMARTIDGYAQDHYYYAPMSPFAPAPLSHFKFGASVESRSRPMEAMPMVSAEPVWSEELGWVYLPAMAPPTMGAAAMSK